MVVFTCNYCGDSVKKPKAEKHIALECKRMRYGNASLCCVDCLQDFDIQTYQAHTKCVTEEQRYSATGFVPKPSSCKGERKQSSWLDVVQTVLRKPDLSMPQKRLLQAISSYENIPRKKVKFLNFIRNSGNFAKISSNVVEAVYEFLELEFKAASALQIANKTQNTPNGAATEEKLNKLDDFSASQAESIDNKPAVENVNENSDVLKSRKRKKGKIDIVIEESVINDCLIAQNENQDFGVVKSKKKKKNKSEKTECSLTKPDADSYENSHLPTNDLEKKIENIGNDCIIQNYDDAFTAKKSKGKKKYKNKENVSNDPTTEADVDENSEPVDFHLAVSVSVDDKNGDDKSQNKKKKKRKLEQSETESDIQSKRSRVENDENEIRPKKFSWECVVKNLLEKSKDGEMSLKKITKKVVAEYQSSFSSVESFEEISKKFNKKMKKFPFVIVSKERVSLYVQ